MVTPPWEFGTYKRGTEIGAGAFGRVFRCRRSGCTDVLAVKVFDLQRLRLRTNAEAELRTLRREVDILKGLPAHPNVVRMLDTVEESNWLYMVLELVTGGDLFTALSGLPPPHRLAQGEAAFVLGQLLEGLSFLHGQGIVHRDLKLENVLVTSADRSGPLTLYRVKITDFGLSKAMGAGLSEPRSVVGSRRYIAPEVLESRPYDRRVDLWSLGVLLYVLLEGRYPHDQPAKAAQAVLDIAVARVKVNASVQAVLAGLLRLDPARRLGLKEVRTSRWLREGSAAASEAGNSGAGVAAGGDTPRVTEVVDLASEPDLALGAEAQTSSSLFGSCLLLPPGAPAPSLLASSFLGGGSSVLAPSPSCARQRNSLVLMTDLSREVYRGDRTDLTELLPVAVKRARVTDG